jgi:hypothetical protein
MHLKEPEKNPDDRTSAAPPKDTVEVVEFWNHSAEREILTTDEVRMEQAFCRMLVFTHPTDLQFLFTRTPQACRKYLLDKSDLQKISPFG